MTGTATLTGQGAAHWPVSGQIWIAGVGLIGATIVARVLGPSSYGLFFLALTITSVVAIAVDLCVGQAILTRAPGYERRYGLWTRAAVLVTATAATATVAVSLFFVRDQTDALMWLILCAALPLSAASMVPRAFLVLSGQLRFVSVVDVVSVVIGNVVAAGLILAWASPVAAALSPFLIALIRYGALESAFRSQRPGGRPVSDLPWRPSLRSLQQAVGGVYLSQLSGFASRNGGNLIVSALLGPANLAFYSRAFSFLIGPLQQAQMALNPTMLRDASTAHLAGQTQAHLHRLVPRFFILLLPLSAALGAVGPELTALLLGPGWQATGQLMAISAGLAVSMTVALPARWLLLAARDSARLRVDSALQLSLLAGCAIGALLWGLPGSLIINAVVLGPLIAIVDWMLLPPPARRYFWRRAAPLAVLVSLIPFVLATALRELSAARFNADPLVTLLGGLLCGVLTTAVAYAILARRRPASTPQPPEGQS
jgi:O-antigen/teichoic acid export membrane protein